MCAFVTEDLLDAFTLSCILPRPTMRRGVTKCIYFAILPMFCTLMTDVSYGAVAGMYIAIHSKLTLDQHVCGPTVWFAGNTKFSIIVQFQIFSKNKIVELGCNKVMPAVGHVASVAILDSSHVRPSRLLAEILRISQQIFQKITTMCFFTILFSLGSLIFKEKHRFLNT